MATKRFETPLRPLAVLVFLPGLYLVLLLVAALSVTVGAAGVKLGITLLPRAPFVGIAIVVACGVSGGVGIFSAVRAAWQSLKAGSVRVTALRVRRAEASGIWGSISKVSRILKARPPANLVLGFGAEIFVTDGVVNTYDATLTGRTLCISAPLLRVLTVSEFEAVLAHEMAHFTGNDTLYSHYFYPVYQGSIHALRDLIMHCAI